MRRNGSRHNFTAICIPVDRGTVSTQHVPPPDVWLRKAYWEVDDHIDWQFCAKSHCWIGKNSSVRVVYASAFRRELTGITRALQSSVHPLQRVIIRFRLPRSSMSSLLATAYTSNGER